MNITVTEAVERRISTRAFLPKPVAYDTVYEIFHKARRAPSGGNVQPWKVDILCGAKLDGLTRAVGEKLMAGVKEEPQYDIYPENLWDPHRSYRYKCGEDMYSLLDIPRTDKMGRLKQLAENFRFFGAPVGLIFTLDRRFGAPQWSDVGMLMQTIMLLAVERGLDTCAQEAWSAWHETIKQYCDLDENAVVFAGMAMGYRDEDHPINRLRTERAEVEDFATFHGF